VTAAVDVEHLNAHYGARQVLHDVSLSVNEGEVMVIMGGSGSGKTTLLRHILGLQRPTAGTIRVLGVDVVDGGSEVLQKIRRRIGVAFQSGALLSSLSVGANVMLPLREHTRLHPETMRIMMRLKLDFVELGGAETLMPAELSGGMVKRVALARAIIMDPRVVFLDEPSAGLDPVIAAGIDDLILRLRATGVTLVVVTHELQSALKIADRITILEQGRIVISDTKSQILASDDPRVRGLLNRTVRTIEHNPDTFLSQLTAAGADDEEPS